MSEYSEVSYKNDSFEPKHFLCRDSRLLQRSILTIHLYFPLNMFICSSVESAPVYSLLQQYFW